MQGVWDALLFLLFVLGCGTFIKMFCSVNSVPDEGAQSLINSMLTVSRNTTSSLTFSFHCTPIWHCPPVKTQTYPWGRLCWQFSANLSQCCFLYPLPLTVLLQIWQTYGRYYFTTLYLAKPRLFHELIIVYYSKGCSSLIMSMDQSPNKQSSPLRAIFAHTGSCFGTWWLKSPWILKNK